MQQAGEDSRRENARPEMKKRKVSNFYTGLFGFTSILFSILTTIFVWIFIQCIKEAADSEYDVVFVLALLPVVVGVIGLFLPIYMVLKGTFSAAYMVDAEGMTTYWRKNTYRLLWTDCIEFEIVQVPDKLGHFNSNHILLHARPLPERKREFLLVPQERLCARAILSVQ